MRFAVSLAEIFLIDQVAMADHQQAAVLAGFLFKLERLIEPGEIHPGHFPDLRGIRQRPPTAVFVRGRVVVAAFRKAEAGSENHPET